MTLAQKITTAAALAAALLAGDPVQRAGSRASGGKMGKRKRPGQTARRALLLWPLVCTGGNGSGGVRPGAGGGRYTRVFCPLYPGRPGCT